MASGTPQDTPGIVNNNHNNVQKILVLGGIEKNLLGFNVTQLRSQEIVSLFDLRPADVTQALNKLKLPNSKKSVTDLLIHKVQKNFPIEEMKDILYSLQLYQKVLCSKKVTWEVTKLMERSEDFRVFEDISEILLSIKQVFRIKGLNAVVKVLSHQHLIWVMIIEKLLTQKKGIKLKSPIYFCFDVELPYIFFASTSKFRPKILECIVKAMKYKKSKFQHLQGKDITSMLDLLKNKSAYKDNLKNLKFHAGQVVVGSRAIDFSQTKAREVYANQVFDTKKPVKIESFTAHVDGVWHDNNLMPEMAGEPNKTSLLLKSKTGNVIDMIKWMQTNNVVATPLPQYLQAITSSARNTVNMRAMHH